MTSANPVPLKLLIVDDDPMMRLGLTAALGNQEDFEILGEATDGRQGIEQAATLQPDVVLMDFEGRWVPMALCRNRRLNETAGGSTSSLSQICDRYFFGTHQRGVLGDL